METWFGKSLEKTDSSLKNKTIQKDGELEGMVIERLMLVHHHISKVRAYFLKFLNTCTYIMHSQGKIITVVKLKLCYPIRS